MNNIKTVIKGIFSLLTSTFDVGSDVLNSFNFLGWNISAKLEHDIKSAIHSITSDTNNTVFQKINAMVNEVQKEDRNQSKSNWVQKLLDAKDDQFEVFDGFRKKFCEVDFRDDVHHEEKYEADELHETWGYIGLGITFLPGAIILLFVLPMLCFRLQKCSLKNILWGLLMVFACCTFPMSVLVGQFFGLFAVRKLENYERYITIATGVEAYFESAWQMVFQFYTIMYGYPVSNIQVVSILISFFLLANTSISVDTLDVNSDCWTQFKHLMKSIPVYTCCIIFRISSLSLTFAFLREYAVLSIGILWAELLITCYVANSDKCCSCSGVINSYFLSLSNMGVMNAMPFDVVVRDRDVKEFESGNKNFIVLSSIVIFVHHSLVLIGIMLTASANPTYFKHWIWPNFQLSPANNSHFYWVFGGTLFMGLNSMILTTFRAENVVTKG